MPMVKKVQGSSAELDRPMPPGYQTEQQYPPDFYEKMLPFFGENTEQDRIDEVMEELFAETGQGDTIKIGIFHYFPDGTKAWLGSCNYGEFSNEYVRDKWGAGKFHLQARNRGKIFGKTDLIISELALQAKNAEEEKSQPVSPQPIFQPQIQPQNNESLQRLEMILQSGFQQQQAAFQQLMMVMMLANKGNGKDGGGMKETLELIGQLKSTFDNSDLVKMQIEAASNRGQSEAASVKQGFSTALDLVGMAKAQFPEEEDDDDEPITLPAPAAQTGNPILDALAPYAPYIPSILSALTQGKAGGNGGGDNQILNTIAASLNNLPKQAPAPAPAVRSIPRPKPKGRKK